MKTFEVVYRLAGETFTNRVAGQFQTLTHAKAFCRDQSNFPPTMEGYMITSNRGVEYDTRKGGYLK